MHLTIRAGRLLLGIYIVPKRVFGCWFVEAGTRLAWFSQGRWYLHAGRSPLAHSITSHIEALRDTHWSDE